MIKKFCKTPYYCIAFLVVCIAILTVISPRTESLGPSTGTGSGSGTTSGGDSFTGSGGGFVGRAYGFQGMLTGAQNDISPPGYRMASTWHSCSPESHPYGCSAPQMSLTVPSRGPFPYPMSW